MVGGGAAVDDAASVKQYRFLFDLLSPYLLVFFFISYIDVPSFLFFFYSSLRICHFLLYFMTFFIISLTYIYVHYSCATQLSGRDLHFHFPVDQKITKGILFS